MWLILAAVKYPPLSISRRRLNDCCAYLPLTYLLLTSFCADDYVAVGRVLLEGLVSILRVSLYLRCARGWERELDSVLFYSVSAYHSSHLLNP